MSWGTCYSGSNNINFNFPPIMADARVWSGYQPEAVVNERIQKKQGIKSNWEYRQYLQQNGIEIMNFNNTEACNDLGLSTHAPTTQTPSGNVPYKFKGTFDTSTPGFGYRNSDLKNPYLTAEQLNMRLVAPSINTNNFKPK